MELWAKFHESVDNFEPSDRETFSLVWYNGLSYQQAADCLQITKRSVVRRMNAVRRKLQAEFGGLLNTGE